ncbi:L-threonine dehydratase catabolic TdcB isoform X2 [Heterodontus francisci]|uniref:L-threonine dehydratase catabolic TdcB isoform X2 n=1 Tax=Heterodontus francisci TaxID=7792 RepID=UPI00355B5E86
MEEAQTLLSLQMLQDARETVERSTLQVIKTPLIHLHHGAVPMKTNCNLYMKLENMQTTGSFKIRGVANQFSRRESGPFITMSAGNYGKAFAYASKHFGHQGKVLMADTAPASRTALLASYGVEVEQMPSKSLLPTVEQFVKDQKMIFLHPFDDIDLIAGYGSIGLEILEEIPNPDVVIVCCGGGGLLAGVAAAIKLSGCTTTNIYGVEPKEACTMYRSFSENKPVLMDAKSIAIGLAPPFAGSNAFQICRQHVKEILLVSDDEIKEAVSMLYNIGLVVEPSGAAAFAAIVGEKINLKGKTVVVIITGGNVTPEELCDIIH